jgi:surface polysaccharide O-acyltransferase-like enzyme
MKEQLSWANHLRAFAAISVIVLHIAAPILYQYGKVSTNIWWFGNVVDGTVRYCVPIFLMLSGTLILSNPIEIKSFFVKRVSKIIGPFIFWSLIYLIFNLSLKFFQGEKLFAWDKLRFILSSIKNGAACHFWFIYMLLGLYLIFPIISRWITNCSQNEIRFYLIIWFATLFLGFPILKKYFPDFNLIYFSGYLGYPILGYYLSKVEAKVPKVIYWILFLVGSALTIFGSYYLTLKSGVFQENLYAYLTPNVAISSIGVFMLFKGISISNKVLNGISNSINNLSFGIYLVHILVLDSLAIFGIQWSFVNPVFGLVFTLLVCLILSYVIIFLLRKVPLLKNFIG